MLDVISTYAFSARKRFGFALLSGLLALAIFAIDLQFPRGVAIGLLYITVVLISLKSPLPQDTVYAALLASLFTVVDYVLSAPAVPASISLTNRTLYLATIWTTAVICLMRKKSERERQELQRLILESDAKEHKQSLSFPLTKFMSNLLRLSILARILREDSSSHSPLGTPDLTKVVDHIDEAIKHARQATDGLTTASSDLSDLTVAMKKLTSETETASQVQCRFNCAFSDVVMNPSVVFHLYRITQTALRNAAENRKATEIIVTLEQIADHYRLTINDNGLALDNMASEKTAMLQAMEHRADMIGAALERKQKPEGGMLVLCSIPAKS